MNNRNVFGSAGIVSGRNSGAAAAAALLGVCGLAAGASAQQNPGVMYQIFEMEWDDMERRAADIFMAGAGSLWIPPPTKAGGGFSVGYDLFDRFDFGSPPLGGNDTTLYGTEASFDAMVDVMRRAGIEIYFDAIFNHNGFRTTNYGFHADGGWPGFYIPLPNPPRDLEWDDDWGDYHGGANGRFLNNGDDEQLGDLSGLVDINQASNQQFIRHPVDPNDPDNIPPGNFRNLPDPANAQFYGDTDLAPLVATNPATPHKPATQVVRHPFNLSDPMEGDAVMENATGLMMRWAQWMVEVKRMDGFRLDAKKHVPAWFWDTFFDTAVYQTRTTPWGTQVTPFSFGESTTSNTDVLFNFYRKDSFANRDSLDLTGAGQLRNLINGGGTGSWTSIFPNDANASHLDFADDGLQNGSAGVFHVFSHDNGTQQGNFIATKRQQGWFANAYVLTRPGVPIVYHNAKQFGNGREFPDEGIPTALGLDNETQGTIDVFPTLNKIHNTVATGDYYERWIDGDILIFERAAAVNGGPLAGNILVGVNDRYDNGVDARNVQTAFPPGTTLVEYTGNAMNPEVDPNNSIPDTLTVAGNGSVTITVPRNRNINGDEHNRGYVVYGPPLPVGTLTIPDKASVIDPDPTFFPDAIQRMSEIDVVQADTFTLRLETTPHPQNDGVTDDNALFKVNNGTIDLNGSGAVDIPPGSGQFGGFEEFATTKLPGMRTGSAQDGLYEQVIDATQLPEGMNFIRAIAFRQRPSQTLPLFEEQRRVVYIDRLPPVVELDPEQLVVDEDRPRFRYFTPDGTVFTLHTFLNLPEGSDPVAMASSVNRAGVWDRDEWRRTFDAPLEPGENTLTVVTFEQSERASVEEFTVFFGDPNASCSIADLDGNNQIDVFDLIAFLQNFQPAAACPGDAACGVADLDQNNSIDVFDLIAFLQAFDPNDPNCQG